MKISITPILRKDKINGSNSAPLALRVTINRKVKYVSLGISAHVSRWDFENNCLIDNYPDYREENLLIETKLTELDKKIKRLQALDIEITLETLLDTNSRRTPNQTVSEYFDKLIKGFENADKINSAVKHYFCLSSLKKFHSADITFDKIDKVFL